MKKLLFAFFLLLISSITLHAKITLPALIDNNMVLQRETTINIWGTANENTKVKIWCEWQKKPISVMSDSQGKWQVDLQTPAAGGPYKIEIKTKEDEVLLNNILIGDVWFCSGQSNMEVPLKGFHTQPIAGSMQEILNATKQTQLRMFKVERNSTDKIAEQVNGEWQTCTPTTASEMSAVAYLFGKQMSASLNIPIGIINSSWGGSAIQAWLPIESIDKCLGVEERKKLAVRQKQDNQSPALLFNGMISAATNYKIKGFLWYQGESNIGHSDEYIKLQSAMVEKWRQLWGDTNNELGFYFVQIAPYAYGTKEGLVLPLFVEAQQKLESLVPNSYMATTTDLGEPYCIHPANKKTLAERLAALALKHTYKQDGMECSDYPKFKSVTFEGSKALLVMENMGNVTHGEIVGFELAGEDKVFYPAQAFMDIQAKNIEVTSEKVLKPIAVRYAFRNVIDNNLKSNYGVAAPSFRTDNWD